MKPFLYILILAMLVTSVSAVAYSDEYYTLGKEADGLISNVGNLRSWDQNFQKSIWLELRRHTILMEKQNELLEEQNELLKNKSALSLSVGCGKENYTINGDLIYRGRN